MKISEYVYRNDALFKICEGKRVLHLGCIGSTDCSVEMKISNAAQSLHAKVSKISECEGVDLDEKTVGELNAAEIFDNVVVGDVEKLLEADLRHKEYDVVLAGDIIEHVSNPGLMLDGIRELISTNGILLISTPNAFGAPGWIRYIFGKFREGEQHVLCFNPITLEQLVVRHGFEVISAKTCYQEHSKKQGGLSFKLFRQLLKRFPRFGGTLLYLVRLK